MQSSAPPSYTRPPALACPPSPPRDRRHPAIRLVADLSHYTCVAEAATTDPELNRVVREVIVPRVHHVHARVGFEEGPQVRCLCVPPSLPPLLLLPWRRCPTPAGRPGAPTTRASKCGGTPSTLRRLHAARRPSRPPRSLVRGEGEEDRTAAPCIAAPPPLTQVPVCTPGATPSRTSPSPTCGKCVRGLTWRKGSARHGGRGGGGGGKTLHSLPVLLHAVFSPRLPQVNHWVGMECAALHASRFGVAEAAPLIADTA